MEGFWAGGQITPLYSALSLGQQASGVRAEPQVYELGMSIGMPLSWVWMVSSNVVGTWNAWYIRTQVPLSLLHGGPPALNAPCLFPQGSFKELVYIFYMLKDAGLAPDLLSYAAALQCMGRLDKDKQIIQRWGRRWQSGVGVRGRCVHV